MCLISFISVRALYVQPLYRPECSIRHTAWQYIHALGSAKSLGHSSFPTSTQFFPTTLLQRVIFPSNVKCIFPFLGLTNISGPFLLVPFASDLQLFQTVPSVPVTLCFEALASIRGEYPSIQPRG
ncbi:hypothetical protein ES702_02201 [subsurface metagenome]